MEFGILIFNILSLLSVRIWVGICGQPGESGKIGETYRKIVTGEKYILCNKENPFLVNMLMFVITLPGVFYITIVFTVIVVPFTGLLWCIKGIMDYKKQGRY